MSARLSVCLLTRNDAQNLPRVIGSVREVADEIVVAETGSSDDSAAVAASLGARVIDVGWDDDFSAGRNAALAAATGDWILWINPDEELLDHNRQEARRLIEVPGVFAYLVKIQNQPAADRADLFSESWDLRLYQRRDDLHYQGRLHPAFSQSLARQVSAEGLRVDPSNLAIRRHAYLSNLTEPKLRWARRLLEKELADRPGQLHYLIEYGRTLLLLKDPRGHEVMAEALDQIVPRQGDPAPPSPDVQVLLEYLLRAPEGSLSVPLNSSEARALALKWFPNSPALLWPIAEQHFRAGQFHAAAVLLDWLTQLGMSGAYDRSHGFDPRVVGPWAWLNLGVCRVRTGEPERARACFEIVKDDPEVGPKARILLAEIVPGGLAQ
jgi:hypothetical protein